MLSGDVELWEWDKENGEELDLVFNVSLREGVGSCYIQSRRCRLLVNRLGAVRRRCDWSLPVCILEQSNLFHGVVF